MKLVFRAKGPAAQTPYKLLSVLFLYPDERIVSARPEILEAVAQLPASPQKAAIERFCLYWATATPTALAQAYVDTFDLQKRSGLYLSFYLYGDTRQRGMALLRLKRLNRAAGMILDPGAQVSRHLGLCRHGGRPGLRRGIDHPDLSAPYGASCLGRHHLHRYSRLSAAAHPDRPGDRRDHRHQPPGHILQLSGHGRRVVPRHLRVHALSGDHG